MNRTGNVAIGPNTSATQTDAQLKVHLGNNVQYKEMWREWPSYEPSHPGWNAGVWIDGMDNPPSHSRNTGLLVTNSIDTSTAIGVQVHNYQTDGDGNNKIVSDGSLAHGADGVSANMDASHCRKLADDGISNLDGGNGYRCTSGKFRAEIGDYDSNGHKDPYLYGNFNYGETTLIDYQKTSSSSSLTGVSTIVNAAQCAGPDGVFGGVNPDDNCTEVKAIHARVVCSPNLPDSECAKTYAGYFVGNVQIDGYTEISHTLDVGNGINVVGDINATGNINGSDERLKENIVELEGSIDKVMQLRGVYYDWNEVAKGIGIKDENRQFGVIAQEVESVLPEVVKEMDNGYKGVDYAKLTALLIESTKEQQMELDEKDKKINELELELNTIKLVLCEENKYKNSNMCK